jgi:hypothetical protein
MKTSFLKASGLAMLIAVIAGWIINSATNAAPHGDTNGGDNYVYHSDKLNVNINMPDDWRNKIITKEDDRAITVLYNNQGGQPVFLYSVTKIAEQMWLNIKDGLSDVHIVAHKNGEIYFVQLTDKTSIKGANSKEFKAMVANLNDVLANIRVG